MSAVPEQSGRDEHSPGAEFAAQGAVPVQRRQGLSRVAVQMCMGGAQ